MAPPKIGLEAVLEDKNFRKGLKNYIDGIEKMEKGNEEMSEAAKKSGKSLDGLSDDMKKGGKSALDLAAQMVVVKMAMNTIKELAGKGLELAKLGATAERVEERFAAFSEEAGGATAMLEAFQKGAGNAASEMDAMLASSKLLQMGLVTNAEEMETTVELATRLGDQTASVTARVEDFALMLANQSIPRLDNFGISSGQVKERMAELMSGVDAMTRETAFMTATIEIGGQSLDILGERTKDTAMTFEIMEARMTDARVELGKKFAPVAGAVFEVLGGLGDEVLMVGAAFGEFGGALVQAGPLLNAMMPALKGLLPAIGKLPAALKAMNLGLNASTLAMGGILALIPLIIIGVGKLKSALDDYAEAVDEAVRVQREWDSVIEKQVKQGRPLENIIRERTNAINEQREALKKRSDLEVWWQDNVMLGTQKRNREVMISANELTQAIMAQGFSAEQANVYIRNWNKQLGEGVGTLTEFTDETMILAKIALPETAEAAEDADRALFNYLYAMETGIIAAYEMTAEVIPLTDELRAQADAVSIVDDKMFSYIRALQDGTILTDENAIAQANLVYEIERQKEATEKAAEASEKAAEAEEKQAEELERLKEAHDRAREAAFNHAAGLLTLAERLSNAEDKEALFRASIAKLLELKNAGKLTDEEYLQGAAQLQMQFGFTTEAGVFLTRGVEVLGEALGKDKIKLSDYGDLVEHLGDMGEKADPKMGAFKDVIAEYETPAEAAARRTEEMTLAIENQETPIGRGFAAMDRLKNVYGDSEEPILDSTEAVDDFTGKATDADQPTKDLTEKVDRLNTATGESVDPMGDATEAVDDFAEATLNAQEPVDELLARFELLPDQILRLKPQMEAAGKSLVDAFRFGFERGFDLLEKEKIARLEAFRREFHESRNPKDTTSPLMGFYESGQALVQTYMEGLESEWPNLGKTLDDMFSFGRAFGGLGGIAGGILNKQIREMKGETKDIDAELQTIYKRLGGEGRLRGGAELSRGIADLLGGEGVLMGLELAQQAGEELTAEQQKALDIYRNVMGFMHERHELTEEQIRLQEKLTRMEEAQTRLRFLEQQVALLKMIEEHGLDAQDILQGLTLGAEASAEEVLDAMVRAMDEVVRQAEERLGIDSPSKVFFRIGQETMAGMAMGIQDLATLPVRQSVIASRAVASAPAMSGGSYTDNSRSVTIQAGGNTITNAAEGAHFETRVLRAVKQGLVGQ